MTKINNRELKNKLWQANPYCFWCGVYTMNYGKFAIEKSFNGTLPLNCATIDHVFPINHPLRALFDKFIVIACNECNKDRDQIHTEFNKILRAPLIKLLFENNEKRQKQFYGYNFSRV